MVNTREEILAEMNLLRIMVFNLWEMHYGKIDETEMVEFKENILKNMENN